MNKYIKEYFSCRICNSEKLNLILDFDVTALANSFLKKEDLNKKEFKAPLKVNLCENCGCVQLSHTVSPNILFDNYLYESSTSESFRNHFKDYASHIYKKLNLKPNSFVFEIGSNDGILLKPLIDLGVTVLGVEPAQNINKDYPCITDYFSSLLAKGLSASFDLGEGRPDVITANNVLAHIDSINDVIKGVNIISKFDTIFVFENAYLLDTIKKGYYDQIYHEHLLLNSIKPLKYLFQKYNMEIFDVEQNNIQGGTIRVYVKFKINTRYNISPIVESLIKEEEDAGLYSLDFYKSYVKTILTSAKEIKKIIAEILIENKTICAYGAPAKFTTLSKVLGLNNKVINYVVDDAKMKQGLYTPDTHIPIVDKEYFIKNPTDYCLITAWNFAESIMKNNNQYKGKYIFPF